MLYEMLTGKRAFEGGEISDVLAGVIKSEPAWGDLPANVPPLLRVFLRRCLEKDPKRRIHDIADVRLAMEGAFETAAAAPTVVSHPRLRVWQRPLPLATAIVTLIVATGFAARALTRPVPPRVVRFTMTPSGATALELGGFNNVAIAHAQSGPEPVA